MLPIAVSACWQPSCHAESQPDIICRCMRMCTQELGVPVGMLPLVALHCSCPSAWAAALQIDPSSVVVEQQDFDQAIAAITPASHRSAAAHARYLQGPTRPLPALLLQSWCMPPMSHAC